MATVGEFARSLVAALAAKAPSYSIDRAIWGPLLEPIPQRAGSWRLSEGSVTLEVARMDSLYGYMRLAAGGCRVEGLLEYRQWEIVFKPQRVEGECSGGGEPRGIEALPEEGEG